MTTLHDSGSTLGRPSDTSAGLSQSRGHGSWLACEAALQGLMEHEILMIREIPAACNSDRELGKVRPKRVFVSGESGPFSGHPPASFALT